MMFENKIRCIGAREILDSRGNPTVEATVYLEDGSWGTASVPSGASTGKYEAHELRDGDERRYQGKGVLKAVENIRGALSRELAGMKCVQGAVDCRLIHLDDTENKRRIGANATLAVSLAAAKAGARYSDMPLYRYVGGVSGTVLPVPMMNILNGGAHAGNNLDIQEFMILPMGFGTFAEALRAGAEVYHRLGSLLKQRGLSTGLGDEGGFAPDVKSAEEALDLITEAIRAAGYDTDKIKIALDAAVSEWAAEEGYVLPKSGERYDSDGLIGYWGALSEKYPILSIEDGLGEDDHDGWVKLTKALGGKVMLVGDDYFVTNPKRLREGIRRGAGNAVLVKPNQIGTLTEVIEVVRTAKAHGYRSILSHRSGETGDTTIADLAVALNTGFIKTGAPCRSERVEKYNRLLKIEQELGGSGAFAGI